MPATTAPSKSERLPANSHPLNQLAKRYLRLEHVELDPDSLYLLQLVEWGLESKKVQLPNPQWGQNVLQSLQNLGTWKPEEVLNYLSSNPDDPQTPLLSPRQLRKAMSARRAAREVMNALDLRMTVDPNVDYPPNKYPKR